MPDPQLNSFGPGSATTGEAGRPAHPARRHVPLDGPS
jgi:hypothetical protein